MASEKKTALRKLLLEKRDNTSHDLLEINSKKIHGNLKKISEFRLATKIGMYYPIGSEVFTQRIIQESLSHGLKTCLPKVAGTKLEFRQILDFASLEPGSFGILEPKDSCAHASDMEVIIVPAVGASADRHRLGYGRGFYDRFFEKNNITKIALCLQKQVVKNMPYEDHDIRMDYIITEQGVYKA